MSRTGAKEPDMRIQQMLSRRGSAVVGAVAIAAMLGFWVTEHGQAHASGPPSWAPGVIAKVSSMDALPPVANPPGALVRVVQHVANNVGGNPQAAVSSLRRLHDHVARNETLYGFSANGSSVCLVFWNRGVVCPTSAGSSTPGVIFDFSPGGPGYPGQAADLPAAIGGLASDDVVSVSVKYNGVETSVPISNNSFFVNLGGIPAGGPWSLVLSIGYADGTFKEVDIPDPRS
jgi:hypothetical protein